ALRRQLWRLWPRHNDIVACGQHREAVPAIRIKSFGLAHLREHAALRLRHTAHRVDKQPWRRIAVWKKHATRQGRGAQHESGRTWLSLKESDYRKRGRGTTSHAASLHRSVGS